jgi:hypothetical protein
MADNEGGSNERAVLEQRKEALDMALESVQLHGDHREESDVVGSVGVAVEWVCERVLHGVLCIGIMHARKQRG